VPAQTDGADCHYLQTPFYPLRHTGPETPHAICQPAGFGYERGVNGNGDVISGVAEVLTCNPYVDVYPANRRLEIGCEGLGRAAAVARQPGEVDLARYQRDGAYC